ncbi:protein Niban 1-like [Mugil cephalus]|uniref:protein Niban 1-like n=1 Tax=Mugil cephalus TaxID=48193 RepID=UPI001FB5C544|nr:protein Niban 1-like [Mugil cephalus]
MGASSSGLLDEAKINHIKGLVDSTFQSFSAFYRQQYPVAYFGHLHQEVEPKKEGRGLLLTQRPQHAPEEVLYQGSVKISGWDEQGKKSRERYVILRRDYKVEIHDNMETFNRGCAAKMVLHPAGGRVFTTEEESRAHLEKTCAGILNGVKEDSSSAVSSPDGYAVYLHLPYTGHTCFLFQQVEERDHFLSDLKTCIRHCNLDPWSKSTHENQTYTRALRLYRQDKGCYESWEMLLGTEEQVLASQVMEEVLPWLQSQLQSRVKGKKTERIRQWLATVQATYTLVLEQLTAGLQTVREECRQTALTSQGLIRSNLDQIMTSHLFLEQKVRACICEEAEKVCAESVAPYLPSILEALTENISAGILGMQRTLHTQMDAVFSHTNGETEATKKALSGLCSIRLDQYYQQVENLTEKLGDLKERFGLSSPQRLVHSANLEMEQLLDSAVYTLEQFLQSSARLQPSLVPVKMERAKERVLKQLDYDSRVVQRRLYQEALLEITQPSLIRRMDSKWKTELQQFEQYIFSDYSSFILVHNVYDDILRNILSKEIETVLQDATGTKGKNLLLDTSDLAISQYSLLGQTPPRSAPESPAVHPRHSSSTAPSDDTETTPVVEDKSQEADVCPPSVTELTSGTISDPITTPMIVVTQQFDGSESKEAQHFKETSEEVQIGTDTSTSASESKTAGETSNTSATLTDEASTTEPSDDPGSTTPDSPDSAPPQPTDIQPTCNERDQTATPENPAVSDLSPSDQVLEEASSIQPPSPSHPPGTDSPVKLSLGSLSDAIGCSSTDSPVMQTMAQQNTDRAVYLTGQIKDNWEVQRVKEEQQNEATGEEGNEKLKEQKKETETDEKSEQKVEGEAETGAELDNESSRQREIEERLDHEETSSQVKKETRTEDEDVSLGNRGETEEEEGREEVKMEEESPESPQPEGAAELPLDSIAIIRELVTETTEVETIITHCPDSSTTP